MLHPISIYRYKHIYINPKTGKMGTRWDYEGHEGNDYPDLVYILKRSGERIIYLNKPSGQRNYRRPDLGLFRGGGESISGIFEPDIEKPGFGFGDLNRADALLTRRNEQAGTLIIMVFPGLGKQASVLFGASGYRVAIGMRSRPPK